MTPTTRPLLDRRPTDGALTVRATDGAALVLTVRTLGGRRQSVTLDVDDAQALRGVLDDWLRRMDLRAALLAGAPAMLAVEAAATVRLSRDPDVQTRSLDEA